MKLRQKNHQFNRRNFQINSYLVTFPELGQSLRVTKRFLVMKLSRDVSLRLIHGVRLAF